MTRKSSLQNLKIHKRTCSYTQNKPFASVYSTANNTPTRDGEKSKLDRGRKKSSINGCNLSKKKQNCN